MIYIVWTCRGLEEARKIVHGLLTKRLIACGSIIPMVHSIYWWEGEIEEAQEAKVILKTVENRFEEILQYIQAECSYDMPEIVQIEITRSSSQYLAWVERETTIE